MWSFLHVGLLLDRTVDPSWIECQLLCFIKNTSLHISGTYLGSWHKRNIADSVRSLVKKGKDLVFIGG